MSDIVGRIDDALRCVVCDKELGGRCAPDDWCSDLCFRSWFAARVDQSPPTLPAPAPDARPDGPEPAWASWGISPADRPATERETTAATRSLWRDLIVVAGIFASEFLNLRRRK